MIDVIKSPFGPNTVVARAARVRIEFQISPLIGEAELLAVHRAVGGMLAVLEHGANDKQYDGKFIEQGYKVQIAHAVNHLRHRGRPDPQSGLDEILHTITRLAFAYELTERGKERAAE